MNWSYLFKHWFGTLLLGPIIGQVTEYYSSVNSHLVLGYLEAYPVFIMVSLFCSSPTYILYGFLYLFLAKKNSNPNYAKVILILFAVSGVIISFWLIGGSMSFNGTISYCIASILAGLLFKLNFKKL
ncbi:hypothetical protein [Flavobacterium sp.]|uniref:hypothetical protein n=1 Tax=Flavobacterium sp. TaxID=239 RepID=UPI002FD9CBD3